MGRYYGMWHRCDSSKPYVEGYTARAEHVPMEDNPYKLLSHEWDDWIMGWLWHRDAAAQNASIFASRGMTKRLGLPYHGVFFPFAVHTVPIDVGEIGDGVMEPTNDGAGYDWRDRKISFGRGFDDEDEQG